MGPQAPCPHLSPQKKAAIQSYGLNESKQNTQIYASSKRSCRQVNDPVARVIITETHSYHMHTSVNVYCASVCIYKEARHLKSQTRQYFAKRKVWNFFKLAEPTPKHPTKHPQAPDHCPPLTPPPSRSLTLLL